MIDPTLLLGVAAGLFLLVILLSAQWVERRGQIKRYRPVTDAEQETKQI